MAVCPECGKPMVKTESAKKKGFFVLKHENADDQKNCGVKFIPVGGKGGDKTQAGASAQDYSKAAAASKKANSGGSSSGGGNSSGSSGGSGDTGGSGGGEHRGQGKEPVQRNESGSGLSSEYPYYK